ncbi:MAG: precorrin-8X methylmutase [Desulfobacterales bacterium]|jgi:precorrin-8X/cobalt-precorrin-8 methylmutase
MRPDEIESRSFEIIDREAGLHNFTADQWAIVQRIIHTSADFEYMQNIRIHPEAVTIGIDAIRTGRTIITDTNMARVGIRSKDLREFGVSVKCFMDDPAVHKRAEENGTTRAKAAVDAAIADMEKGIYVIGNAPTALLHLVQLLANGKAQPALIIGLPVGFVNAAESKAALMETNFPYISNLGRKGGSNIAASVVNALTKLAMRKP